MSFFAKSGSITHHPLLNDSNYPYWKVRMKAIIKSLYEKAWRSILTDLTPPTESRDLTKHSRLVMLTTRFENLRMTETKSLTEFYERLFDIANEYFSLGEKLENSVLVRKIVRVLLDRFQTKLTVIEEAKDLDTMKAEELMGSLRTFELNQQIRQKEKPYALKEKSIALKILKEKNSDDDVYEDKMALLTNNFKKYMKKIGNKKPIFKSSKSNNFSKPFDNNYKRGDSESSDEEDNSNNALTFVVSGLTQNSKVEFVCLKHIVQEEKNSECESNEYDLDEDFLKESYKDMYDQWLNVCSNNRLMASNDKSLKKMNDKLDNIVKNLENDVIAKDSEIKRLLKEINLMVKGVKILNPNSRILVDVICAGQKAVGKPPKKIWVKKNELKCLAAFTCHKTRASNSWYFDSGHSRHMIGDANILTNFKSLKCGVVTFGDCMTWNIVAKSTLNLDGLPKLKNVLLVEGLKVNLISISQICDQYFIVNFSRDDCNVVDQNVLLLKFSNDFSSLVLVGFINHRCQKGRTNFVGLVVGLVVFWFLYVLMIVNERRHDHEMKILDGVWSA
ncbi:uncharacterized protein LOC133832082 [Humulus lupulus]|uniref:uncharacterized protein LOC133832082 n=1 Tax=Humulus lupulus TaxID=3486 RepID=UPI002B40885C|nr:uncharacterized protein LOC133832082 [Humulus lupulus]